MIFVECIGVGTDYARKRVFVRLRVTKSEADVNLVGETMLLEMEPRDCETLELVLTDARKRLE